MSEIILRLSEDEALVLFEFFSRYEDKNKLFFVHLAEYLALMKISAQLDKSTSTMFQENYKKLLEDARKRVAKDFESDFPPLEREDTD